MMRSIKYDFDSTLHSSPGVQLLPDMDTSQDQLPSAILVAQVGTGHMLIVPHTSLLIDDS